MLIAPPPARQLRTIGGDLFHIALAELGDATQWDRIADANGLVDPWLSGYVILNIPTAKPAANGG